MALQLMSEFLLLVFRQEVKRPRRWPDSRRVWALAVVQHITDVIAAPVAASSMAGYLRPQPDLTRRDRVMGEFRSGVTQVHFLKWFKRMPHSFPNS